MTWQRPVAVIGLVCAALAGLGCTGGDSRDAETLRVPLGSPIDYPYRRLGSVGVGEHSFLVAFDTGDGVTIAPVTVDGDDTVLGQAVAMPGDVLRDEPVRMLELRDGSWLLNARSCTGTRSPTMDNCAGDLVERFYRWDSHGLRNLGAVAPNREVFELGGELADGTVLYQSDLPPPGTANSEVQGIVHSSFVRLDPDDGTVVPTAWNFHTETLNSMGVPPLIRGCATATGFVVVRRAVDTEERFTFDGPDSDMPESSPWLPGGELVCARDGDPQAILRRANGSEALVVYTVGHEAIDIAGPALTPPGVVTDLSYQVPLTAVFNLANHPRPVSAKAFIDGDWLAFPGELQAEDTVRLTGDGRFWIVEGEHNRVVEATHHHASDA